MPVRDVICLYCGYTGKLDIHYVNDVVPKELHFRYLGHNPYSGDLHYQCPGCEIVFLVDPMTALGEESLRRPQGGVSDLPSRQ